MVTVTSLAVKQFPNSRHTAPERMPISLALLGN